MQEKLKLYTEFEIIPKELSHTFILIPFLKKYSESEYDPDKGRFDDLESKGKNIIEIVSDPDRADFFLLPFGYSFLSEYQKVILDFVTKAEKYNKKCLVFYNSDDHTPIKLSSALIYRTSFDKSKAEANEFALPGWSIDFKKYFERAEVTFLSKLEDPEISYCGYIDTAKPSLMSQLKGSFFWKKNAAKMEASQIRGEAYRKLKQNKRIKTNFIIRDGFWAAGIENKAKAREEYAQNFIKSMYALVVRGAGNFSYRLNEVLSCGRIPVFINTDSALPFDNLIDWKKHVVWIESFELSIIDKLVCDFHDSKTSEELLEIQRSNRKLYEEMLSPLGFFRTLALQVKKEI